eukprot:COSAG01_NODE_423_length_17260_cov_203.736962_5_plen_71_part_00
MSVLSASLRAVLLAVLLHARAVGMPGWGECWRVGWRPAWTRLSRSCGGAAAVAAVLTEIHLCGVCSCKKY